jgi:hypothetical protein
MNRALLEEPKYFNLAFFSLPLSPAPALSAAAIKAYKALLRLSIKALFKLSSSVSSSSALATADF